MSLQPNYIASIALISHKLKEIHRLNFFYQNYTLKFEITNCQAQIKLITKKGNYLLLNYALLYCASMTFF